MAFTEEEINQLDAYYDKLLQDTLQDEEMGVTEKDYIRSQDSGCPY